MQLLNLISFSLVANKNKNVGGVKREHKEDLDRGSMLYVVCLVSHANDFFGGGGI